MELRIHRTYRWLPSGDASNQMIGGKPVLELVAVDELQMRLPAGDWTPVPIVKDEIPQHPDVQTFQAQTLNINTNLADMIACSIPKPTSATSDSSLEK